MVLFLFCAVDFNCYYFYFLFKDVRSVLLQDLRGEQILLSYEGSEDPSLSESQRDCITAILINHILRNVGACEHSSLGVLAKSLVNVFPTEDEVLMFLTLIGYYLQHFKAFILTTVFSFCRPLII